MENSRFVELVQEAIEGLPEDLRQALDNIRVDVEEWPDPELLRQLGYGKGRLLLGLFQGVPLTRRRKWSIPVMPDRIVIYKGPIEKVCGSEDDVKRRIQTTVLHEIGHLFGLDERRLKEHGYG